ncbi:MAG: hypothetical protein E6G22_14545 [Actinobacteria bacterium]|nr:MAG: hypothetical protein E6G22_14545 [Actinomycetota bacterium]
MPAPAPESRLHLGARNGAHLTVLSAFALAQPLLDILGKNAAFFAIRGSTTREIVLFALAITLLPPAAFLALELVADLVSRPLARTLHLVFVGGLSAVVVLHVLTKSDSLSGVTALVAAAGAGVAAAAIYLRARPFRSFLSVLVPAPLVFVALFLLDSPASKLVFADTPKVEAATTVRSKTPVVLVVFDELTTVSLMNRNEEVDAGRYPNFASLAASSTWYRSATTADWLTEGNVPAILTGRKPVRNKLPIFSEYPHNLFTLLGKSYRLRVIEAITHLCPKSLCKDQPQANGQAVEDTTGSLASDAGIVYLHLLVPQPYATHLPPISDSWGNFGGHQQREEPVRRTASGQIEACGRRVCQFTDMISGDPKPTLYFLHTVLPHWPFVYLPSGRRWALDDRPLDGYKEGHWLTSWAALEGEQRYLLQLGYADRSLGLILRKLRQTGLYDRSLVIVTGDEGESFRGDDQRRRATATNTDDIAFVPLFVHLPGQKKARVVDSLAPSIDILPTIAHVLHVPIPWHVDGRSLVGRKLPPDGPVSVARDVGEITRPLAELRARRRRTLAQQLATFGSGTFDPLYRVGPHPQLVGRKVSSLSVRPSPKAAVRLDGRSYLAAIDPSTDFLPTHVSGAITGAHGAQLDLAVAVNGTIASVTRTHLDQGQTRFATFVPEDSLRPGSNAVDVFAVHGAGRRLALEELRGGDLNLVLRDRDIESTEGKRTRIDPAAIAGTVQVSKTAGGYAFKGLAATRKKHRLVDSLVVFADGKAIFAGAANDLRPLRFLDKGSLDKTRFRFELPRALLPAEGQDHSVRVFAIRGRVASELAYRGGYPWAHG